MGISQKQLVQSVTNGKTDPKTMRKALVAALRSGLFRKTTGSLCKVDKYRHRCYCVAGVASKVAQLAGCGITERRRPDGDVEFNGNTGSMATEVRNSYGFFTSWGHFGGSSLISRNDSGESFTKLADIIESEPAGLFVN